MFTSYRNSNKLSTSVRKITQRKSGINTRHRYLSHLIPLLDSHSSILQLQLHLCTVNYRSPTDRSAKEDDLRQTLISLNHSYCSLTLSNSTLMMISGVSLVLGGVRPVNIIPARATGRPSAGGHGSGPSGASRAPARVVRCGLVALVGPESLEADERGDGDRDDRGEDGFLCEQGDTEVREGGQSADLHLRCQEKGQDRLQQLFFSTTWNRVRRISISLFS